MPGDQPEDGEGQAKMHRQPVGGDIDHPTGQPRGDHPPADRALQTAQHPKQQQPPGPSRRHPPRRQEEDKARRPDQPDHPAKLAVPPFPPVDRLEGGDVHLAVLQLEFRAGTIKRELGLPFGVGGWRHRPGHRAPFGDRQAGIGQPGQPADRDHRRDQDEKPDQPGPDRAAQPAPAGVDHAACGRRRLWRAADLFEYAALAGHGAPPFAARH